MSGRRILPKRIALADKPGAFKKEDVQCPICWSILFEPVALPCTHALCYDCFTKHVKETSLQCPCCRMRLSIWSRKAFRENNLVDKRLWERIQKEFPKLVETRRLGNESQDLPPDAFVSTIEKNPQNLTDVEQCVEFVVPTARPLVRRDAERGEIKRELEEALKKHEEDIENRKVSEEKESQELILKLQVEQEIAPSQQNLEIIHVDFNLATKLAEEETLARRAAINAKRKLFTESPSSDLPGSGGKLSSKVPTVNKKRPSSSSSALARSHCQQKRLKNGRFSNSPAFSRSSNSQQGSILSYLVSSQSQTSQSSICSTSSNSSFVSFPQSPKASTSAANIRSVRLTYDKIDTSPKASAFLPLTSAQGKHSPPTLIPQQHVYKQPHQQQLALKPFNRETQKEASNSSSSIESENTFERNIPSANSIDGEVNCHFRPIRSAPKTPPQRRPDGSYLPEPKLVVITPVKLITITSTNSPPTKVVCPYAETESESSDHLFATSSSCDDAIDAEIKVEAETTFDSEDVDDMTLSFNSVEDSLVPSPSPVDAGESQNIQEQENSQSQDIEDDIALLIHEEKEEPPLSQNSHMEINHELMLQQRLAFKELQKRLIQEAEDRKLAKKLEKELNKPPGREGGYRNSLRSWLNKGNNASTPGTSHSTCNACMTNSSSIRRNAKSSTVTSCSAIVIDVPTTDEED